MEIIGPFLQEIMAVAGYAMVFAGVYKLFQLASDIREIKEAVLRNNQFRGSQFSPSASSAGIVSNQADGSLESATAYAENLLRAVNSESRSASDPVRTSNPRP